MSVDIEAPDRPIVGVELQFGGFYFDAQHAVEQEVKRTAIGCTPNMTTMPPQQALNFFLCVQTKFNTEAGICLRAAP